MNNDLISREALKKAFENLASDDYNEPIWYQQTVFETIDNAPTVAVNCKDCDGYEAGYSAGLKDAERPTGEWIEIPVKRDLLYNTGIKYTCSICGRGNCYGKPPFCMYCGAEMKGGME